jgi:phage nucleotide-binding protein
MQFKSTKELSNKRVAGLIVGESGIGKTSLAKTLPVPHQRVLIGSAESGLLCLQGTDIPVFEIDPTDAFGSIGALYEYLQTDEAKERFDYIMIDSLTEISQLILANLKEDPKLADPKNAFPLWNKYAEQMIKLVKVFRDMNDYSVFFTCLTKQEKDGMMMVDELNVQGSTLKDSLKSYFDLVLHYKIFTDAEGVKHRVLISDMSESRLSKDRSGKLEAFEQADLSAIINKILL